jgi:asparagine synthase (glutamine-hydrolysing)
MCGITGFFGEHPRLSSEVLERMNRTLERRGPDDSGSLCQAGVGLAMRRLSIIDLGGGHQPISNEDGTVQVVFNGEIYNYRELRDELQRRGHRLATHSDTEVIVHLYEDLGARCVERLRGMFAFAIWDARDESLLLARDRVGIKPLYVHAGPEGLSFASEVKALLELPWIERALHPAALHRFLTNYYVPGDETVFRGILKLLPGHTLTLKNGQMTRTQYWDLAFPAEPRDISLDDAKKEILDRLHEAVRLHMISDVPVGFLLSGGVDSTAMLALAKSETDKEISTFTVGFDGAGFADERPFAKLAADRFGTKHFDTTLSSGEFRDTLPAYIRHMEEPVCEPPAIALYQVSRLARQHVKVLISGEGGDEAFAGYPEYRSYSLLERARRRGGASATAAAARLATVLGVKRAARFGPLSSLPLEQYYFSRSATPFAPFNARRAELCTPEFLEAAGKERLGAITEACFDRARGWDDLSRMLYVDTKTWLPDDLLIKADKITMAHSIELRVPLLDHEVMEFAASLPSRLKVKGLQTKVALKAALEGLVPQPILERRKAGFPVPYAAWLRNDLREFVSDTLLSERALQRGLFRREEIERLLATNRNGGETSKEIFSLTVVELWHQAFMDGAATP